MNARPGVLQRSIIFASTTAGLTALSLSSLPGSALADAVRPTAGLGAADSADSAAKPPLPGPVTGLVVSRGNRALTLAWKPPVEPAEAAVRSFTVTWRRRGGHTAQSTTVPAAKQHLTITGLTNDTRWEVSVAAVNVSGTGLPTDSASVVPRVPTGDYDGDGHGEIATYNPTTGVWAIHGHKSVVVGPHLIAVPGDYDGDGRTDLATYNPTTGAWAVHGHAPVLVGAGLVPVPGDYNGDGRTDVATYNPATGAWAIHGQQTLIVGRHVIPVPGDYNADGRTDVSTYNPLTGAWAIHGQPGFIKARKRLPVPGDYKGTGRTEIATYKPASGAWTVPGHGHILVTMNAIPEPGDYNGKGATQIATYNPTTGAWTVHGSKPVLVGTGVQPLAPN